MTAAARAASALALACGLAGCAGGDDARPALGFGDAGPGAGTLTPDAAVPGPAGDARPGDARPDGAPDGPGCLTDAEVAALCARGCDASARCDVRVVEGAACAAACPAAVRADPAVAVALQCLALAAADGSCEEAPRCTGATVAVPAACEPLCADLAACEAGPDTVFGAGGCGCRVGCAALARLAPGVAGDVIACAADQLAAGCTDAAGALCLYALDRESLCARLCQDVKACQGIPGAFPSQGACVAACRGWEPGPLLAARACADRLDEHPAGCYDPASCFPPPAAPAPGAAAFCGALAGACGSLEAAGLWPQADLCAWSLTGLARLWPGVSWADAEACVEALDGCEDGADEPLACVTAWAACDTYCERLEACDLLGAGTSEAACVEGCAFAHLVQPGPVEQVVGCVAGAGSSCKQVESCQTGGRP